MSGLERQQAPRTDVGISLERQIVLRARELISDRKRWVTHIAAADSRGIECGITSPNAYGFCQNGALQRAAYELGVKDHQKIAERIIHQQTMLLTYGMSPYKINDQGQSATAHAFVLKLLDDTAERVFPI